MAAIPETRQNPPLARARGQPSASPALIRRLFPERIA
jgi:hypothetical protein